MKMGKDNPIPSLIQSKEADKMSTLKANQEELETNDHKPVKRTVLTTSQVGFVSLPNQLHRKAVRRGFDFNLMVTGSPGLGKSGFINALFCSDVYNAENPGPSKRNPPSSGTRVDTRSFILREGAVQLRLRISDTPGFGQAVDNSTCWQPIVDHLDEQFETYLKSELKVARTTVGSGAPYASSLAQDTRVHACIYFVNPNGHGLHQLDIETLKRLHSKVNLVVVIAKADSMTPEECAYMKETVSAELKEHQITVYDFPDAIASLGGSVDEKSMNEVKAWCKRQPFAVVTSDRWIDHADGKKVRGRAYPWGIVETENLAHNDFTALKNLLLNVHLQDLIDVTHTVHYANYYSQRLSSIAEASRFPVAPDGREPLSQLEAERIERQKKLAQLEADMEAVFEQKVLERTKKQEEMERDLNERLTQLNDQLVAQFAAYEKERRQFDEDRALWESENREALILIRSSMDKLDVKDKARSKRKGFF